MACNANHCDEHDFMVAPNSAWCLMEYSKRSGDGSRLASDVGLAVADAIHRIADLVEDMLEAPKSRFQPRQQTTAKPTPKRGGTPL